MHADSCTKVPRDQQVSSKKKAEPGWYSFNSQEEAADFLKKRFPDKSLFEHYCIEEHT
jgi:hypothetical protein